MYDIQWRAGGTGDGDTGGWMNEVWAIHPLFDEPEADGSPELINGPQYRGLDESLPGGLLNPHLQQVHAIKRGINEHTATAQSTHIPRARRMC